MQSICFLFSDTYEDSGGGWLQLKLDKIYVSYVCGGQYAMLHTYGVCSHTIPRSAVIVVVVE